jgi:hypothetical protein
MASFAPRISEYLLLTRARAKVSERSTAQLSDIRRWWFAARKRLRIAERLDPRTELVAVVPLYREGFVAIVNALLIATEPSASPVDGVQAAWEALEQMWPKLGQSSLDGYGDARKLLLQEKPALDVEPVGDAHACATVDRLTRKIEQAVEPRTRRQLIARAALRIGTLATACVAAVALVAPPFFAPRSLALHKPVKLSSVHSESMAPPTGEWLVNGRIERTYGAHTAAEDKPWMEIDLQQSAHLGKIVVYNRGDGWLNDCLPLAVDVGTVPTSLHRIAVAETLFTQTRPWVIQLDEEVRFVRLTKLGRGAFALSEVGVYSR